MYSYWEKQDWFEHYDYVIIGAGIVGLTSGYYINKYYPERKILVMDRHFIPQGASTKNAGFLCFGTVGEILDDLDKVSKDEVINTIKLRWNGLKRLNDIHDPATIDQHNRGGSEVFTDIESLDFCCDRLNEVNEVMEEAIGVKNVFEIKDCLWSKNLSPKSIFNSLESELNPVKMIKNLISILRKGNNVDFLFGVQVNKKDFNITERKLILSEGLTISYDKLMICTNAFAGDLFSDLDVIPYRNQVLVSETLESLPFSGTFHYDKGYVYFREINNRLLIGGARNIDPETEKTSNFGANNLIIEQLSHFARQVIIKKNIKFEFQWSGIIATGSSKKPILRSVNDHTYVAVRLGGMGVAIGSELAWQLAGKVVSDC